MKSATLGAIIHIAKQLGFKLKDNFINLLNMKTLTKNAVKRVAEDLMAENTTTTNLDIKEKLRKENFYASQQQVSSFMDQLTDEEGYGFSANGQYRTFSRSSSFGQGVNQTGYVGYSGTFATGPMGHSGTVGSGGGHKMPTAHIPAKKPSTGSVTINKKKMKASKPKVYVDQSKIIPLVAGKRGDWKVYDSQGKEDNLYFPSHFERNAVRYRYYTITGVPYVDTRCKKIR